MSPSPFSPVPAARRDWRGLAATAALAAVGWSAVALSGPRSEARPALAAEEPALVGAVGGTTHGVALRGAVAFVLIGHRLVAVDVSDPAHPRETGSPWFAPGWPSDLVLRGDTGYVSAAGAIQVLDLSDPRRPGSVDRVEPSLDNVWSLALSGDRMALATSRLPRLLADAPQASCWGCIDVLDISDPRRPVRLGTGPESGIVGTGSGVELTMAGDRVYSASRWSSSIGVWSIEDPVHPTELGSMIASAPVRHVGADANRLYATHDAGLAVMGVDVAGLPAPLGALTLPSGARELAFDGDRLLVGANDGNAHLIDVSDAAAPRAVSALPMLRRDDRYYDDQPLALSGERAYAAAGLDGLRIASMPSRGAARELGRLSTFAEAGDTVVVGTWAYTLAEDRQLAVVDRSVPGSPRLVDLVPLPQDLASIVASARFVYGVANTYSGGSAGTWTCHLVVLDVAQPRAVRVVAQIEVPEQVGAKIAVAAPGRLVLAGGAGRVTLIDASEPARPRVTGSTVIDGMSATSIAADARHAYILDSEYGLRVIDVAGPDAPSAVAGLTFAAPRNSRGITLRGNALYAAAGADVRTEGSARRLGSPGEARAVAAPAATAPPMDNRLVEIDVSDPLQPRAVRTVYFTGNLRDIVSGERGVYALCEVYGVFETSAEVLVIDGPEMFLSVTASHLALEGDFLYAGAGNAGLLEIALEPSTIPGRPTPTPTATDWPDTPTETASPTRTALPTWTASPTHTATVTTATSTPGASRTHTPTPASPPGQMHLLYLPAAGR